MEAGSIRLRGYREGDLDALYALDVECFEPAFRFTRASMRRYAEAKRGRVVIAEADGQMVGFCIVHIEREGVSTVGYGVTFDVAVAHRRRGVAQALLAEAERQCMVEGCVAMTLHVHTGNEGARRFYDRSGFAQVAVAAGYYGAGLDAEVWSKRLG